MIKLISSVSYSQVNIFKNIVNLHIGKPISLDPTYSKGNFYKKFKYPPKYKYDLNPQIPGVKQGDSRKLPFKKDSLHSISFDPPFVVAPSPKPGIIRDRFGCYKNVPELWEFYRDSLREFYRIIRTGGFLIFKCQDIVSGGVNHFSHCVVYNYALEEGFIGKDLFILIAKNRLISPNMLNQKHARKYHSYFWVFKKGK